jgi:antitoxin component YwqK of YwqJK toxin-antitoxin module
MKISTLLIILISLSLIIYFSINVHPDRTTSSKFSFTYRDGLFYEKNSNELFTGRVVDTADVIIEFEVSNGKKNGRFTTYYFEGGIEKVGTILDNKNEGTWKYYYENGQIETIGNFYNNLPDGEWISYYRNGEVSTTGTYREGMQIGYWLYFDNDGKLLNSFLFLNDVLIEKVLNTI